MAISQASNHRDASYRYGVKMQFLVPLRVFSLKKFKDVVFAEPLRVKIR